MGAHGFFLFSSSSFCRSVFFFLFVQYWCWPLTILGSEAEAVCCRWAESAPQAYPLDACAQGCTVSGYPHA